eukprot:CAMPEP_0198275652 /NCGR_PEP_ID=MMETSP1447-20131203/64889_1 /TAXON_ID=420782 /ORGANISM="Chaetoceros dichaeta, Strain CCMP1751" /LENGTH=652 /DNA_ID=CAMNT_0043970539 /DNA_START=273 /DNA_END=2231 /DNA_ORIENTATION=-
MTWNLIESLTGFWTGDDWFSNGRQENVVSIKTHYPHSAGRKIPFANDIQRALILIRHPMDAIPSYHNYQYEVENGLTLHSVRAPVDAWIPWRDLNFETELNIWKDSIIFWMDSFSQEDRMVMFYENIVEDHTGPSNTLKLSEFLAKAPGVEAVDEDRADCVWRAIIRYHESETAETVTHEGRRLEESSIYIDKPEYEHDYVIVDGGNSPGPAEEMESSPSNAEEVVISGNEGEFLPSEQQEPETSPQEEMQPDSEQSSAYSPMTVDEADITSPEGELVEMSGNEGEVLPSQQEMLEASLQEMMQPDGEQSSIYSSITDNEADITSPEGEMVEMSVNDGEFSPSGEQMLEASTPEQTQPDGEQSSAYLPETIDEADNLGPQTELAAMSDNEGEFSPSQEQMLESSNQEQMQPDGEQSSPYQTDNWAPNTEVAAILGNEGESPSEEQMLEAPTPEQMQPDGEQSLPYPPEIVGEADNSAPNPEVAEMFGNEGEYSPSAYPPEQMQPDVEQSLPYPPEIVGEADNSAPNPEVAEMFGNEGEYSPSAYPPEIADEADNSAPNPDVAAMFGNEDEFSPSGQTPETFTMAQTQPDGEKSAMYRPNPSSLRSGPMHKPYTWNQHTQILGVLRELRIRYDGSELMDMFDIYIQRVLYNRV